MNKYLLATVGAGLTITIAAVYEQNYNTGCTKVCTMYLKPDSAARQQVGRDYIEGVTPGRCDGPGNFQLSQAWWDLQHARGVEVVDWTTCRDGANVGLIQAIFGGGGEVEWDGGVEVLEVSPVDLFVAGDNGACACWKPDAGACNWTNDEGQSVPLGDNNLAPKGRFSGSGCFKRPCGEFAGRPPTTECFSPDLCACQSLVPDAGYCLLPYTKEDGGMSYRRADSGVELEEGTFRKQMFGSTACIPMTCSKYTPDGGVNFPAECLPQP